MHIIAVVPIVVNAGAAVLPAMVAGAASIVAILFKPRALAQLLRKRPKLAMVFAGGVALLFAGSLWLGNSRAGNRRSARSEQPPASRIDWAKVAEDIIAQERVRSASGGQATAAAAIPAATLGASAPNNPEALPVGSQIPRPVLQRGPAGLNPLWAYKPDDTVFFADPASAGTRIFVAGCQADLGGYTGLLACLDSVTGKVLWQVTQSGTEPLLPFFSSPAVTPDGKYVIIGQGLHQDRDCALLCFEAQTGKPVWAVKTPLHIESSPAIFGDLAVVGAGAIEGNDGKAVGDPGFVMGVRISDGKMMWKQAVNDPESSPGIDKAGMVFIGSGCNGQAVVAIRSESDEVLQQRKLERLAWRTEVGQPMLGPITLAGEMVIAAGGNGDMVHSSRQPQGLVVALDRQTGKILWQTSLADAVLGAVGYRDGILVCPVRNGEVVALAASDGHILWRGRVSGNAPVLAGCIVTADRTYAVSNDGYLVAFATGDGKVLEKVYLNDQGKPGTGLSMSSPQIIDNRIIVGTETGGLRCLQGSGGAQ